MSGIRKILLSSLVVISFMSPGLGRLPVAQAQGLTSEDLGVQYASSIGLTVQDPRVTVAKIIRIVLGFLGTIAVILVIYAGFMWMTSNGNEDKVTKAKNILKAAVIGLVIILSAFAITSFIINQLLEAVGPGTTSTPPGPGSIVTSETDLHITGVSPSDGASGLPRNTTIRFQFNGFIDSGSVTGATAAVQASGETIAGQWLVNGREIVFKPDSMCTGSCGEVRCLPENGVISVHLTSDIKSLGTNPKHLVCGGLGLSCDLTFSVGSTIDCQDPQAEFISTIGICAETNNLVQVAATDDSSLARFEFLANGQQFYLATGDFGPAYEARAYWQPTSTAGEHFTLKALVDDIASHQTTIVQAGQLLPAHCCNGQKDSDEEGIDCGGSCLRCHGSACASDQQLPGTSCNNNLCRSGFCTSQGSDVTSCKVAGYATGTASCCLCKDKPRITSLSPRGGFCHNNHDQYCSSDSQCTTTGDTCDRHQPNAKAGNLITILGSGFGSSTGSVIFTDSKLGDLAVCGSNSWSDNQIIVKVPSGATTGIVQVKNKDNFVATSTQDLIINNIARPGLCSLSKASGTTGEQIDYHGLNFENGATSTIALYGTPLHPIFASESIVSPPNLLKAIVPSLQSGLVTTFVRNDSPSLAGPASNFLLFHKLVDPGSEPQITSFEPTSGPPGQYVTIFGHGFGNIKGNSKVFFGTTEANYNFPEVCASSVWSDRQVIVKVPSGISGSPVLKMELANGATLEAREPFTVNTKPLAPSLCLIRPTVGPPSTKIEVWGEYFRTYDNQYSKFSFQPNIFASSTYLSWQDDGTLSKASSTVPAEAVTGPVRIINSQGVSNGLNFKVGSCRNNSDCLGQVCCPASSANAGQCRASGADCYGLASTCVYRWSFTTGSGNMSCPSSTTACGSKCCHNDTQLCINNVCTNKTLLSCNDYSQCNGALYCPNSPGWCSQNPDSTVIQGLCGDESCKKLFEEYKIPFSDAVYNETINKCLIKDGTCDLAQQVQFQLGANKVTYSLTCENSYWTTRLTAGQCPSDTSEYGQWQLLTNNICQSDKKCTNCLAPLQCLVTKEGTGSCGLNQKVCGDGFKCDSGKCVKEARQCECCCDKNLNKEDKTNPGCCLPLTCDGTCGSGPGPDNRDFGVCSGCAAAGPSTTTRDAACNCLGTTGKYCNTATAAGFCSDCAKLSKEECTAHSTCCYDTMLDKCRGTIEGNRLSDGHCGYYECDSYACANKLVPKGQYTTKADCEAGCRVINLQGESCDLATTTILGPNYVQQIGCGYQFCSAPFSCRTVSGPSVTSTNQVDCGVCCCDPANDHCNKLSPNLYCAANRDQCTGAKRGLCCGCQRDDECGSYINNGCGQDSCCRARASLKNTTPKNNDQAVCRNASIEAFFSKPMAVNNLSNNVLLIADYGTQESCPNGTTYLASADSLLKDSWWGRLKNRLLAWLRPDVLSAELEDVLPVGPAVEDHTYCALNKTIKVKDKRLIIQPSGILPANRLIFVVLITDSNLQDGQAEGIIDQHGIGLAGGQPLQFNNLHLPATLSWSFKTSNEICRIDHVEVDPTSVLLSDMQASSTIRATAVDFTGQALSSYYPQYSWEWLWSVGNPAVVRLTADNEEAVLRPQNKKDAETYARATAQVTADQAAVPGASLPNFYEDALVRVFLCANPWPARRADGSWQPWTDSATNMQFYYCRDGEGNNQSADLPGLKVVSSTDPQASSPAFYFFRYQPITTAPVNVSASAVPAGGAVQLKWDPYPGASGYKVYYGLDSGQYFTDPLYVDSNKTQATISNLINGQLYYFAVSAIVPVDLTTFAETPVSIEAVIRPQDTIAPAEVRCLKQVRGKNRLDLTWQRNQDDTVGYRVEYRASNATGAGQILLVDQPVSGTEVRASIVNLIDPQNIIVTVKAVDAAGNISPAQSSNLTNCK